MRAGLRGDHRFGTNANAEKGSVTVHRGDFGTDLPGESDTVLNRLGGEVRLVGREQYILVQGSPPSHPPGDFLIPLIRLLPSDLVDATK
jgi:hypothetical protein